jgi:hypothetical protein
MRGRVDFWKDVFAKYGKYQVVIHHREFPQITFGTMDFRDEALTMSSVELSKHREVTKSAQSLRSKPNSLSWLTVPIRGQLFSRK